MEREFDGTTSISERNRGREPFFAPRFGPCNCLSRIEPSFTRVASGAAQAKVQQGFASCIEMKKAQHNPAIPWAQRQMRAYELVVNHSPIYERYGTPCLHAQVCTCRQTRAQNNGIEQVALQADVLQHRAIVKRAGQRRNEVHLPSGSTLDETAPRDLNYDLNLRRFRYAVVRFLHAPSIYRHWYIEQGGKMSREEVSNLDKAVRISKSLPVSFL
jgi:hypothetical protein